MTRRLAGLAVAGALMTAGPHTALFAQELPPAAYIDAADVASTMQRSIANNLLDTKVKEQAVKGGVLRVGVVHRPKPEPRALMHQELTEIYSIVQGSGTLITGGRFQDPKAAADPPNLGNTPTFYGNQIGGVTQKVKPNDVIIIPAGTPHRFLELDGPITYVIYRFEPAQAP
jgi:mannose-6-phosphate isomerase-like protein (cupin superfamily)